MAQAAGRDDGPATIDGSLTMSDNGLHVVFGTGPAGTWTARALCDQGYRVRAVNRTGHRPEFMPAEVEIVSVTDAGDAEQSSGAAEGAAVVYQALNPAYEKWAELFPPLQRGVVAAARAVGARYVSLENLYMYGPVDGPMTPDLPYRPSAGKGRVRAEMARELAEMQKRGEIEVVTVRASDYYGPGVTASALGERTLGPLVEGTKAEILARGDAPHSYAYICDVGRTLATLGARDEAVGSVWFAPHAPALTQEQTLEIAADAAGVPLRTSTVSPLMLRLAGFFMPAAGEMVEMLYEFEKPFVADSSATQKAFGLEPTPLAQGLAATVDWYKARAAKGGDAR
jgi:nucleoside-diphosphate-sugar epimerase